MWSDLDGYLQALLPLLPLHKVTQQIYQSSLSLITLNF